MKPRATFGPIFNVVHYLVHGKKMFSFCYLLKIGQNCNFTLKIQFLTQWKLFWLHQKSDQMFLVASFGVTKLDKSGCRLNFNLIFYDEYLELCVVNNSISHSMISHNATLQFSKIVVLCSLIHII